ncbi:MAG: hypothetical protein WBH66_05955, partial [Rectinemataceae bacterium]
MYKGKKPLVVVMAILLMVFASCATKKPIVEETPPPVTTTTIAQAPIPEAPTSPAVTPVATVTTTVVQPSVSETELRNLFGQANSLKMDADQYDIARVMPETYRATDLGFTSAKADYDKIMDDVNYDGVKAYPVKGQLENSISMWEYQLEKGMPLRVEEESDKANTMKIAAESAEAPDLASDRFQAADEYLVDADAMAEAKEYSLAISTYQQSAAAFDVAAEKATANKLRTRIFSDGFVKYAEDDFTAGEAKYNAEEELWASGTLGDLETGADTLREANASYELVIAKGVESKSVEAGDSALQAKERALSIKADINAPDQFESAESIMAEGLANQKNGNPESATIWFGEAADAYDAAYDASLGQRSANEEAIASAESAVHASEAKAQVSGVGNNVYLPEAKSYLETAKTQSADMLYADSTVNANEAVNYSGMSDRYVDSELQKVAEAEQARIAAEKAAADPAMADARTRMAWAENNEIKADYPAEYADASSSMSAADTAYGVERYVPAKALAEDVSATLTDDCQAQVLADRQAAADAAKAAEAEQARIAAEKAAADPAMADARTRMAWAENNEIKADYPKQYADAASSMSAADTAYGVERYVPAKALAEDVSATLSDDFQASVLADRKAAEEAAKAAEAEQARIAAEKAAADPAMADARTRMAWAENNEIKTDYPKEYGEAAAAMDGAEISYDNQRYAPAKTLAEEVSTTLSDDFQKKVLADRAAKIEAATQPASTPAPTPQQQASKDQAADAARAKADAAMADAQSRMAWANENGISSDYPGEYKKASAAMVDSFVSYGNGQYNTATAWAKEVSTILSDDFQAKVLADRQAAAKAAEAEQARIVAAALADIDNAQARYDWAVSENAENNYPELLGKGGSELEAAKAALNAEDYKGASDKARAALVSLSGIKAFAPLPEKYVVRLIPARRDC